MAVCGGGLGGFWGRLQGFWRVGGTVWRAYLRHGCTGQRRTFRRMNGIFRCKGFLDSGFRRNDGKHSRVPTFFANVDLVARAFLPAYTAAHGEPHGQGCPRHLKVSAHEMRGQLDGMNKLLVSLTAHGEPHGQECPRHLKVSGHEMRGQLDGMNKLLVSLTATRRASPGRSGGTLPRSTPYRRPCC